MSELAQHKGGFARNLVHPDEHEAWLVNILAERLGSERMDLSPRLAACEKWLKSVGRKWMLRKGASSRYFPTSLEIEDGPDWLKKAVANGTILHRLELLSVERENFLRILDWMRSGDGPSLSSDWSKISVEQAAIAEGKWIDAMSEAALHLDLENADLLGVHFFAASEAAGSGGRDGWKWVEVRSALSLDREGALMRHCVGSYARDVERGQASVFSLRDPENKPRLTMETSQGFIRQLKAFANQTCPEELRARVADFAAPFARQCELRGWRMQTSEEVERAGVVALPGFGIVIAGSVAPIKFSSWLKRSMSDEASIDVKSDLANELLPKVASLGWTAAASDLLPYGDQASINQSLASASLHGRLDMVEMLLPLAEPLWRNSEALRCASSAGSVDVVKRLWFLSDPEKYGHMALVDAASCGRQEVVNAILPLLDGGDFDGSALIAASGRGCLKMAEILLPFSHPMAQNSAALAAAAGHVEIVRLLLPLSDAKASESLALSRAATMNCVEAIRELLPFSDAKACHSRALGNAAKGGHLEAVRELLPFSDPKARNSSALALAIAHGHADVALLLLPFSDQLEADDFVFSEARRNGHALAADEIEAALAAQDVGVTSSCTGRPAKIVTALAKRRQDLHQVESPIIGRSCMS